MLALKIWHKHGDTFATTPVAKLAIKRVQKS